MRLRTRRLLLRPVEMRDAESLLEYDSLDAVAIPAGFLRWPHRGLGEIGYGLHPRNWGRGYATEAVKRITALAFDRFGAHRVQATCWAKNAASARVLVKAGYNKEGRLRGYLKRGDAVRDEFMFGLARADRRRRR